MKKKKTISGTWSRREPERGHDFVGSPYEESLGGMTERGRNMIKKKKRQLYDIF